VEASEGARVDIVDFVGECRTLPDPEALGLRVCTLWRDEDRDIARGFACCCCEVEADAEVDAEAVVDEVACVVLLV